MISHLARWVENHQPDRGTTDPVHLIITLAKYHISSTKDICSTYTFYNTIVSINAYICLVAILLELLGYPSHILNT